MKYWPLWENKEKIFLLCWGSLSPRLHRLQQVRLQLLLPPNLPGRKKPRGKKKKAEFVRMPKMSDTMTDGVIAKWHRKVGDQVKTGEVLAEIETDKASMDYESYNTGTLLYIGANAKEAVKVNGVLAIIGDKNADWKTLLEAETSAT